MAECILIIDDEPRTLQTLARNLQLSGYTVFSAPDGQAGIEIFTRERPGITFVALQMPDMDGCAVLEAIHACEPDVEVILMTAHGDTDAVIAALRTDATGFISKPIEREMLESVLRRAQKRLHTKYELRAAQAAIHAAHDNLEQQVAERTAELNAANAVLRESEKQHRLLTEGVADVLWVFDFAMQRFRYISPSVEQLSGFTPEEIIQQEIVTIFTPETIAHLERVTPERIQAFRRNEEHNYRDEIEQFCKDGSRVWTEVTSHYYLNADNNQLEIYGISRNITARKQAEAAAREQDERLRLLSDNLPNGYVYQIDWGHSPETRRFTYLSAGVEKIHGISAQQGLANPQHIFEQTIAEDLPHVAELEATALTPMRPLTTEVRIQPSGGELRWLLLASMPRQLPDGRFVADGIALDITERKQAEAALQQNAERYRKAQQLGRVGNWEYNIHTTEFWGSEEAKHIYGFAPDSEHFTTEEVESCIPDREIVHQALMDLIEHEQDYRLEFDIITKDTQERRTILSVAELEKDAEGKPYKVTGVIQDITRRKQVETAVARQTRELQALYEASQQLKRSLDLEQIYATIYQAIHQLLPCDAMYISNYDAASQLITCRAGWHEGMPLDVSEFPPLPLNPPGQGGTQSMAIHTGQSLLLNDYEQQRTTSKTRYYIDEQGQAHEAIPDDAPRTRAALIVPLVAEEQVTGIIQVFNNTLNAFTPDDLRLLEALATHIAAALQNAALYQTAQRELAERKQAEAALRESEEKHRRLFETMAQGVTYQAANGDIISANPSAERILGLTLDQMRGKTSMDPRWKMITEDGAEVPGSEHPAMRALQTGKKIGPVTRGVYVPEKDEYIWLSITAIPLFRPREDKPYQVYATFDNITERKHAEEVLRASEAALKRQNELIAALLENLTVGVFMVEAPSGKPLIANAVAKRLIGRGILPEADKSNLAEVYQARKQGSLELYPLEELPIVRGMWGESTCVDDMIVECPDGTQVQLEVFGAPVQDDSGKVWASLISFQDITERKLAEQALRESNERLLTVMNSIAAFIYIADIQTHELLFANEYARKSWGENLIGQPCWKVLQNNMAGPCSFCTNDKLLTAEGKPTGVYQWEFQNTHDKRWYDCRDSAIPWTDGRMVRMEIATDITERKQAEITLRESLKEKTVLLQEVHHRVKNNLAIIIGLLDLQRITGLEPIVAEQFQDFEGRIRSIALIHEMLYQSELLSRVDFDAYLHALVVRLRDMFDPLGQIALHITAPGIEIDPDLAIPCGLIVNELVINALKYAFPASRLADTAVPCLISVTLDWDGTHYTLTVSDNGVGLPPGIDWKSQQTLGLQLVHLLGEGQLHGQLKITNKGGITCQLRFAPDEEIVHA